MWGEGTQFEDFKAFLKDIDARCGSRDGDGEIERDGAGSI